MKGYPNVPWWGGGAHIALSFLRGDSAGVGIELCPSEICILRSWQLRMFSPLFGSRVLQMEAGEDGAAWEQGGHRPV